MKRSRSFSSLLIFCGLALAAALFVLGIQIGTQKAPPFHTGGALFPEPAPAPPPAGPPGVQTPMMMLAQPKNFTASRVSSFARNGLNLDTLPIPLGGEEVVMADIKGPGAITHIWTTYKGGGRDLIIRFYWDGSEFPSIEAPIGDFFGVSMGMEASFTSVPIQNTSQGRSRNCWWYMPFNSSAKITLSNRRSEDHFEGTDTPIRHRNRIYYYVDYQAYAQPIEDIRYFHSRLWETDPPERGKPVKLVEVEGEGHYVGVVLGHRTRSPGWFGEGDDIITVDGNLSFVGTGTEDYFSDAWGLRVLSQPYFGCSVMEGREIGNRLSIHRFHIQDPIPFRKNFLFEIEHWPWISEWPNTGRGYYSSLGFWYQKGLHKPWPRLEKLISEEPWDPIKGRWFVEGALEAEDLAILDFKSSRKETGRPESRFLLPNQSGDYYMFFDSGGEGYYSLGVQADKAGKYQLKVHYLRAPAYGEVQLEINGKKVGEAVDLYRAFVEMFPRDIWPPKEYVFDGVDLKKGLNNFTFRVNSKNPESEGFQSGIDCIILEKEK